MRGEGSVSFFISNLSQPDILQSAIKHNLKWNKKSIYTKFKSHFWIRFNRHKLRLPHGSNSKCFLSTPFLSHFWTITNRLQTVGLTLSSSVTKNNEEPQRPVISILVSFCRAQRAVSSKQGMLRVHKAQALPSLVQSWCPRGNRCHKRKLLLPGAGHSLSWEFTHS